MAACRRSQCQQLNQDLTLTRMHPAPQIKLLKLLGLLGAGDQGAAENMYGVIGAAMQKAALHGNTIGNAIVYEAARAITHIYPNANLLQSGACPNAKLLQSGVWLAGL
jgi:hypothetical protein